jgi:hypothetical protein
MSLIVEDGTGKTNSESYCTVLESDKHHAGRGRDSWGDLDTDKKEIALRLAVEYMTQTYRGEWMGVRTSSGQALDWPRAGVVLEDYEITPTNAIPKEVKWACMELAFRSLSGPLVIDLKQLVKSKKIGPITIEYETSAPRQTTYEAINRMLQPYFSTGSSSSGSSLKIGRC